MIPEERKAIAIRHEPRCSRSFGIPERDYPRCCNYHEGFDDALSLLVPDPWHFVMYFEPHPECNKRCRVVYAIEGAP